MGYAGNMEPSYLIPTVIADSLQKVSHLHKFPNHNNLYRVKQKLQALSKSSKIQSLISTLEMRLTRTRRLTKLAT